MKSLHETKANNEVEHGHMGKLRYSDLILLGEGSGHSVLPVNTLSKSQKVESHLKRKMEQHFFVS